MGGDRPHRLLHRDAPDFKFGYINYIIIMKLHGPRSISTDNNNS